MCRAELLFLSLLLLLNLGCQCHTFTRFSINFRKAVLSSLLQNTIDLESLFFEACKYWNVIWIRIHPVCSVCIWACIDRVQQQVGWGTRLGPVLPVWTGGSWAAEQIQCIACGLPKVASQNQPIHSSLGNILWAVDHHYLQRLVLTMMCTAVTGRS